MGLSLTVITPSLNQGAYLERTIKSVLDQGWPELEYFVVDGGSTDNSVEVIERYADSLAWWVSEPDRGQTDALNKALRRATGDVVVYVNSDDYFLPGAFAIALSALECSGAPWLVGASRFIDADTGETVEVWRPAPPPRSRALCIANPWGAPQPSSFWRREMFERHGLFREDLHYAFDTEHQLRLVLAGEQPLLIDDELAVRFLHREAKSASEAPFIKEARRFPRLFWGELDARERAELPLRLAAAEAIRLFGRGSRGA
jgi:glycosyltransferase involved in cell wall biosynthesis